MARKNWRDTGAVAAAVLLLLSLGTSGMVSALPCSLGPTPSPDGGGGVVFGLWAPHASAVTVRRAGPHGEGIWTEAAMQSVPDGATGGDVWCASVPGASPGDGYNFIITPEGGGDPLVRPDPRARDLVANATAVVGGRGEGKGEHATFGPVAYSVVHDPTFDWGPGDGAGALVLDVPTLVIYEMHVQTFTTQADGSPGTFDSAIAKIPHLQSLGVSAVELLPVAYFPGPSAGWGYNPSVPFSIHPALGGYDGLRRFVRACNEAGIGVILDVVLNHMDPGNALLAFDGWAGAAGTGIYFFQGTKQKTPWGPRPDYAEPQVSRYLSDWLVTMVKECGVSGFRWDSTVCMRLGGDPSVPCWNSPDDIPSGWKMFQLGNTAIQSMAGGARFSVAEDTKNFKDVTLPVGNDSAGVPGAQGGGGFTRQWGEMWYYAFEPQLVSGDNANVDIAAVATLVANPSDTEDPHRVSYTENHDKASSQQTGRIPDKVDPGGSASNATYWALKKSSLGIGAMMASVGTPMLFYGQELVEYRAFTFPVPPPMDWSLAETNAGFVQLVSDLVHLRRRGDNALACPDATARGKVLGVTDNGAGGFKIAAILRYCDTDYAGGENYDPDLRSSSLAPVIAVINMDNFHHAAYAIDNVPVDGTYQVAFNGDERKYSPLFEGYGSGQRSVKISNGQGTVMVPPYSMIFLVWSG